MAVPLCFLTQNSVRWRRSTRTEGGAEEGHLTEEGAGKEGREVLKMESVKKSVFKAPE